MIYAIPEANLEALESKFARLARRAVKLGQSPPMLDYIHEQDIKVAPNRIVRYTFVTVAGARPQVHGWDFVGTIDHSGEINIVRSIPGHNLADKFGNTPPNCHHCGKVRRRNATYILLRDGEYLQVGRNCLQDFVGETDLDGAVGMLELIMSVDELMAECSLENRHNEIPRYAIEDVLKTTHKIIKHLGWTSAKRSADYGKLSTSSYVKICLSCDSHIIQKQYPELLPILADRSEDDAIMTEVRAAIEWLGTIQPENDYLHNIRVIGKFESITAKLMALACSILPAYRRATKPVLESRAETQRSLSSYVGVKGAKYLFRAVRVIRIGPSVSGQFGETNPVNLVDGAGNVYVWWASNIPEFVSDVYETKEHVDIVATIKNHSDFRGTKQTNLIRVTLANPRNIKELDVIG